MSYTASFNNSNLYKGAVVVNQEDVRVALNRLVQLQGEGLGAKYRSTAMPEACMKTSYEGWKAGQIDFARRIAHITATHAARHNERLRWKHRSAGILRRLALVVMVLTVNMHIFF